MRGIIPEIHLNNCKGALEFYKNVFSAEIRNFQMTDDIPSFANQKGKVLHAEIHITPNCILYLSNKFDDKPNMNNIHLVLEMDSEEEIKKIYEALAKEGSINFELQKTFWGAFHAVVTDKFGITWGLNYTLT